MLVLKDVLRKHPAYIEHFYPFLTRTCLEQITDTSGRCAFVWILGTFGEQIDDAVYILEKIIEEEQETNQIDIQKFLIVACTKLFFKKAPEMHVILANLYKYVLKHSGDADLRQKVMFYYRLMQQDIKTAEQIITASVDTVSKDVTMFFEDTQSEKRERLFMEFNTLSVVYGRPSEKFLRDKALKQSLASEKKYYPNERGFKTATESTKLLENEQNKEENKPEAQVQDLLDFDTSKPTE